MRPRMRWPASSWKPRGGTPTFAGIQTDPRSKIEMRGTRPALPRRSARLLRGNPAVGPGVEQVHRQGAAGEHLVVERAQVELRTQFLLCTIAKFAELELADLVGEALPRPRDVAVCLGLDHRLPLIWGFPGETHKPGAGPGR